MFTMLLQEKVFDAAFADLLDLNEVCCEKLL
jgi:hypothetical protein